MLPLVPQGQMFTFVELVAGNSAQVFPSLPLPFRSRQFASQNRLTPHAAASCADLGMQKLSCRCFALGSCKRALQISRRGVQPLLLAGTSSLLHCGSQQQSLFHNLLGSTISPSCGALSYSCSWCSSPWALNLSCWAGAVCWCNARDTPGVHHLVVLYLDRCSSARNTLGTR